MREWAEDFLSGHIIQGNFGVQEPVESDESG